MELPLTISQIRKLTGHRPKVTPQEGSPTNCVHLGRRIEFKPGCNGWMCQHHCSHMDSDKRSAHPTAVPGLSCLTCPDREEE